jgi:phosphoribosylaminoimidazole-succinocarboxamide synthase
MLPVLPVFTDSLTGYIGWICLCWQGNIIIIDEVHTPDSSRYWVAESYERVSHHILSYTRKMSRSRFIHYI